MENLQPKELRIGNYLQDRKGKIAIVEELSKDKIKAYSGMVTDLPLKPIPLTEEWLDKLGAKLFPDGESLELSNRLIGYADCRNTYYDKATGIDLEYVHQLQNLYFALTGEELTINK